MSFQAAEQLSPEAKKTLVQQITEKERKALKKSLIKSAETQAPFPPQLGAVLAPLQLALAVAPTTALKKQIKIAIVTFFTDEIVDAFVALQQNQSVIWQSALLISLCKELNMPITSGYMVQLKIKRAEIFWRLLKDGAPVFTREKSAEEKFHAQDSVMLDWETFRTFKDAGKRGGSVEITLERFMSEFYENDQDEAEAIWETLKDKNILTHRNRLSREWRALSNVRIDKDDIPPQLSNNDISRILFKIANHKDYHETISLPDGKATGLTIFRKERTRKLLQGTGRVINQYPDLKAHRTQEGDVAIYKELERHNQSKGDINPDHIPSCAKLETHKSELSSAITTELKPQTEALEALEKKLDEKEKSLLAGASATRSSIKANPQMIKLKKKIAQLKKPIEKLKAKQLRILGESQKHGERWLTLAISHDLHSAGLTFKASTGRQTRVVPLPFYSEIQKYTSILGKQYNDGSTTEKHLVHMLGAMRYMYRCLMREPESIEHHHPIGRTPHSFFSQQDTQPALLDTLFTTQLRNIAAKR